MKIIAVDDEQIALDGLVKSIKKAAPNAQVLGFRKPRLALDHARQEGFDVAFLDIEMRGISGMDCAKELSAINPEGNIIFATGYNEYALDAFKLHASGYIIKPITPAKVAQELENLRFTQSETKEQDTRIHVRAFGEFEIFYQGKPLVFKYRRSKEMFAYLVDRKGAWCSNAQIMNILFDDPSDKASYFKQLRKDLNDTLSKIGAQDTLMHKRGELCVVADAMHCDYFDWLQGKEGADSFRGEYMSQYSWAESTLAALLASEPQQAKMTEPVDS